MDITLTEENIKENTLAKFNKIWPGALEVFMVLMAFAPERTKVARITIKTIMDKTGFSLVKTVKTLNRLKEVEFIEAPFEGQQGKKQIYKLKILVGSSKVEDDEKIQEEEKSFVYFILEESNNAVKIGCSIDPEKRLEKLQRGNAGKLKLILMIPGTTKKELRLHAKFKEYHLHGEWFRYSDRIKDYIEEKKRENI